MYVVPSANVRTVVPEFVRAAFGVRNPTAAEAFVKQWDARLAGEAWWDTNLPAWERVVSARENMLPWFVCSKVTAAEPKERKPTKARAPKAPKPFLAQWGSIGDSDFTESKGFDSQHQATNWLARKVAESFDPGSHGAVIDNRTGWVYPMSRDQAWGRMYGKGVSYAPVQSMYRNPVTFEPSRQVIQNKPPVIRRRVSVSEADE